jgi:pimeloyl-ACP methyl ester carboxylesterase
MREDVGDRSMHQASPESLGLTARSIALPSGVELHYVEHGDARGEVLLFLHGFTGSWRSWALTLPGLSPAYRTYALTQRGHGDSAKPACCYRPADFAGDVVAFLDALRIARARLIGHSMGSSIAHLVAVDHPERVGRLVLIGWGPTRPTTPAALARLTTPNTYVQALGDSIDAPFVRQFVTATAFNPLPAAFLDTVTADSLKVPVVVWKQLLASRLAEDQSSLLGTSTARALILYGEHNAYAEEGQRLLAAALTEATFISYPAAGHAPHWEWPQRFVDDLHAFLT